MEDKAPIYMVALWEHSARDEEELSLTPGDVIKVVEQTDESWWIGTIGEKTGLFPVNFCQESEILEQETTPPFNSTDKDSTLGLNIEPNSDPALEASLSDELSGLKITYDQFQQLYMGGESLNEEHNNSSSPESPLLKGINLSPALSFSFPSPPKEHPNLTSSRSSSYSTQNCPEPNLDLIQDIELEPAATENILDGGHQRVIKEGELSIKAERCESGVLSTTKHWKQYYVVVQAGVLLVYKHPRRDEKFKGWFDLQGATVAPATKGQSKKQLVFTITSGSDLQPALFQAVNQASYDEWLDTIRLQIETHPVGKTRDPMVSKLPREDPQNSKARRPRIMTKLFQRPTPSTGSTEDSDSVWYSLACDSDQISYVVKRCIEELSTRNCLHHEGLYRLSGNAAAIKSWKEKFASVGPVSLATEQDINVITGVLKLYFRELREPLIPFTAYNDILEAAKNNDYEARLMHMKDVLHDMLSPPSFATLLFLVTHLADVAELCDDNKMNANNLAIVFGPTLAWPKDPSAHPQLQPLYMLVESLIVQRDWFFDLDVV